MPTLRRLRYFESVARNLHFGRAAIECAVSQPALSMQIQQLENELKILLFERRRNGISLTAEGQSVLQIARKVLIDVEDIKGCAKSTGELSGDLSLGIIPTLGPYVLPLLLPEFSKSHPDLKFSIRETQTENLVDDLVHARIDVLVAALPLDNPVFETMDLFEDRFLLAIPAAEPSPPESAGLVKYMAKQQLLLLEEGHCLRDQALQHCSAVGIEFGEVQGTSNLSTLIQLVANNMGVTLVPETCINNSAIPQQIRLIRFPEPQPLRVVAIAWRKTSPRVKLLNEFGEITRKHCATWFGQLDK